MVVTNLAYALIMKLLNKIIMNKDNQTQLSIEDLQHKADAIRNTILARLE